MQKWIVVLLVLLVGIGSVVWAQEEEFQILSISPPPDTEVPLALLEIRISFSQEVVSSQDVGMTKDLSLAPFSVDPPLPGHFLWEDTKTLVIKPKGTLREATHYVFRLRDDFRNLGGKLLAGRHDFALSTSPLRVLDVKQVDYTEEGGVVLECSFSLPVLPQKLRGFLVLKNEQGQEIPYSLPLGPANTKLYLTTFPLSQPVVQVEILPGLTSERGPLGLTSSYRKVLSVTYAFEILGNWVYFESPSSCVINFNTSTPVDSEALAPFVSIDPPAPFTLRRSYSGFAVVGPFLPRERKVVTVKRGAPARNGAHLLEDFTQAILIPDLWPSISFPVLGTYVSPALGARIPIELVNVSRVRLTLWRLHDNNIPVALATMPQVSAEALSELVAEMELFNDAPPNTSTRKAIDLVSLTGSRKGAYIVVARDASPEGWSYAEHLFVLTDIGVVAKVSPQGVVVWANSLEDGAPQKGARVKVFSAKNQLLLEGTCDEEGLFFAQRETPWGEGEKPYIVTVATEDDLSFVVLENELFATSGFDVTGRGYLRRGYEAFLFLARGIFRPGEELTAQGIVRAPGLSSPSPFPVKFVVVNPLGRVVGEENVMLSPEGSASLTFALPDGVPTGAYSLRLALPDGKTILAEKPFLVEEFVPPRLRLEVTTDKTQVRTGEDVVVTVHGEYLFGRKASGIPYSGEVTFESTPFILPGFAHFIFGNGEITFAPVTLSLGEGVLDEEGKASFAFTVPPELRPPAMLVGRVTVTLNDPVGRPVSASTTLSVSPYPVYLGVVFPDKSYEREEPIAFSLLAVDEKGEPKETAIEFRVFRILRHFVLSASPGEAGMRYREEEERILEVEEKLTLLGGKGEYRFTPHTYGEYLVEIKEPVSQSTTTRRFLVYGRYGFAPEGEALPDRVILTLQKSKYLPGEEAVLQYRIPFPGKALFTIETDAVPHLEVLELKKKSGEIRFRVEEAQSPNAYCSLVLLGEGPQKEALSLRALGTVPIFVDREKTRLAVGIETPEKARPGTSLSVTVTVRDADGNPVPDAEVTLAIVDAGVLALTQEPVPDPFAFFNAKRKLSVSTFDLYSSLVPEESAATPLLHPAGGAPEEAFLKAQLSFIRPALFRIVSLFRTGFRTDGEGRVTASFDLPDVATTLRVTAVAFKGEYFGSGAREVLLEEEVVAEFTHPRAVAPKDTFVMPVTLFSAKDEPLHVELSLAANDLLVINPREFALDLPPRGKSTVYVRAQAQDLVGEAELQLDLRWGMWRRSLDFRFPVRPAAPRVPFVLSGSVEPGQSVTLELPRSFITSTLEGKLWLSATPDADVSRIASFLWAYPYGCLEQTVSGAWVALLLPEYLRDIDPLLVGPQSAEKALSRRLRRILSLQAYDGGFSFWPQGESDPWCSAYATHFLLVARDRGVNIPSDVLREAQSYLLRVLAAAPYDTSPEVLKDFYTTRAYAAYVLTLAGERPLATLEELREKREYLRASGMLFLALTYSLLGQRELARELVGGYAPSLYGELQTGGVYESPLREGALALLVALELDPTHAQGTALLDSLRKAVSERPYLTTQEGAFLLIALTEYFAVERRATAFSATLLDREGKTIATFLDKDRATLDLAQAPSLPWTLRNDGGGKAFYSLVADGVPLEPPAPFERGIWVQRVYYDEEGNPLSGRVARGESVRVELVIGAGRPLENVVVVDLIPGGLEIAGAEPQEGIVVDRQDDRLLLFVPYLEDSFTYTYSVTAVTAGTFVVPPVKAECMYNPEIASLSDHGTLTIAGEETP
ncbi:MAG: alpha-2-macroglobulin family protein [Candidatus Caldatribacteriaceae bacterium]